MTITRLVGAGWTQDEAALIMRCLEILRSEGFQALRDAYLRAEPAEVDVSGINILYEPSMPPSYSGMTQFGGGGFVMGPGAFVSETETAATVLQEVYRLATSVIGFTHSAGAGQAGEETLAAQAWADRAVGALHLT